MLYEARKIKMGRFSKTLKLKNSKLYLLKKIKNEATNKVELNVIFFSYSFFIKIRCIINNFI
jgi:hypothetical protein